MKEKKIEVGLEKRTLYRGLNRVAKRCGVTSGHLSHVLRGRREASPRLIEKLAKLGIEVPTAKRL